MKISSKIDGFVKYDREEFSMLSDRNLWQVWSYIKQNVSSVERVVTVGRQSVKLRPGQLLFGRKRVARHLNLSEGKVRTCIDKLKENGRISLSSSNKFSIVTVINLNVHKSERMA